MVVISLDSPSCGVCSFDPRISGCIGTLPDRPRIVLFEVRLSRDNSGGSATPLEEDASKIWDTTRTVFLQGPSLGRRCVKNTGHDTNLLVWRSIMFNGSFLRVCRILQFVKKIRFCLLESGWTNAWCPGLVSRPSAKA